VIVSVSRSANTFESSTSKTRKHALTVTSSRNILLPTLRVMGLSYQWGSPTSRILCRECLTLHGESKRAITARTQQNYSGVVQARQAALEAIVFLGKGRFLLAGYSATDIGISRTRRVSGSRYC
jgi:hypothetical protein